MLALGSIYSRDALSWPMSLRCLYKSLESNLAAAITDYNDMSTSLSLVVLEHLNTARSI